MQNAFNKISLNIQVEDGWHVTAATYQQGAHVPLLLVEFNKSGEETQRARLDEGKHWFIDAIPISNYAQRQEDVYELVDKIGHQVRMSKRMGMKG